MRYLLTMLLLPVYVMADDCSVIDSCNYSSMWSGFTKLEVTYSDSKENEGTLFEYYVSGNESLITFEMQGGRAQIYSIPGVATLWKGIDATGIKTSQECYGIVKDTFAIIESYAVRPMFFLGYGTKGGPDKVQSIEKIDISSKKDTRVQINPGDHMIIGGPWVLEGFVKKKEKIEFEIFHEFVGKDGKPASLFLSGNWDDRKIVIPIRKEEQLNDWLVCISGSYSYNGEENIFTPSVSDASKLKNVGDIKALTNPSKGAPR